MFLLALTVFLFMSLFSYLWSIAAPIFLAFVIYAIIDPPARFLNRRGIKKSIASAIVILIFILIIVGILVGAGAMFTSQLLSLANKMPQYQQALQVHIANNADYLQARVEALPPDLAEKFKEFTEKATEYGSMLVQWFLKLLFTLFSSFSSFMYNFVVGLILAYFLSIEIESWKRFANDKTPRTFKKAYYFLKENVLIGLGGYLKSQLILVSITFAVIFAALLVLRVENAFSIALLAGIFDVLPLLGVSTVFLPWILYLFIVGNTNLAISLSVLLVIVLGTRQVLEPKITGNSLGVSAFTMLSCIIVSLSLFGVAGLILSPILIILLKALHEQGYLKRWIRLPAEEYEVQSHDK